MIVTRENFDSVLIALADYSALALDTETQGLRPYHGDRLFSLILATPAKAFYFNFQPYLNQDLNEVLTSGHLLRIFSALDQEEMVWVLHNAKFDMHFLAKEGIELEGPVYCTKAMARIEFNDHFKYSLADCLERMPGGHKKSDKVMEYINEHGLKTKRPIPGKKTEEEILHFDRVPFEVIVPYGELDGIGTAALQDYQVKRFRELDELEPLQMASGRSLRRVARNEMRLTKTVYKMEKTGVKINAEYCVDAALFEGQRIRKAERGFFNETGVEYVASPKVFAQTFETEKEKWQYTEKGNPSFDSEVLATFTHPAAVHILEARDAKAKQDFYNGFLYHADGNDCIHPSLVPEGTVHGRFSSNNPNFQNLKKDEDGDPAEFIVRRAIIPRPGFKLVSIDYDTMEYKFALELACRVVGKETDLAKLINSGHDFHQATADLVKETAKKEINRKVAKISNFLTLYGGGNAKLASALGCSISEAKSIRLAIIHASPEIDLFIKSCMRSAEAKGYVTNWLGRRSWFSDSRFSYRAPNYIVSGGCADIVKVAMNEIDDFLENKKSRMIMAVHDELVFEVHESEDVKLELTNIMATAFKAKYVPTTCSVSESTESLGDLK